MRIKYVWIELIEIKTKYKTTKQSCDIKFNSDHY